jgi:hypothetical protein
VWDGPGNRVNAGGVTHVLSHGPRQVRTGRWLSTSGGEFKGAGQRCQSAVAGVAAGKVGVHSVPASRAGKVMRQVQCVGLARVPHRRASLPCRWFRVTSTTNGTSRIRQVGPGGSHVVWLAMAWARRPASRASSTVMSTSVEGLVPRLPLRCWMLAAAETAFCRRPCPRSRRTRFEREPALRCRRC